MNIIIEKTCENKTLSIIDPDSGVDYIADFIGNHGALSDGQFTWDDERGAYVCDQDTFDWWDAVVKANQALDDRIHDLVQEHGVEKVYEVANEAGGIGCFTTPSSVVFEVAANVNQALDEAFGFCGSFDQLRGSAERLQPERKP